jgi:hypothetical protein
MNFLQEHLKKVKNRGCQGSFFDSALSMIAGKQFVDILNTNNSTKIRQIRKSLFGVSIGTRISRSMKKRESKIGLSL